MTKNLEYILTNIKKLTGGVFILFLISQNKCCFSQSSNFVPHRYITYDLIQRTFSPIVKDTAWLAGGLGHHSNIGLASSINRSFVFMDKRLTKEDKSESYLGLNLEVEREGHYFRRNRAGVSYCLSKKMSRYFSAKAAIQTGFFSLNYQGSTTQSGVSAFVPDISLATALIIKNNTSFTFLINQIPNVFLQPLEERVRLPRVYNFLFTHTIPLNEYELVFGAWYRTFLSTYQWQSFLRMEFKKLLFTEMSYFSHKGITFSAGTDLAFNEKLLTKLLFSYQISQSTISGFNKYEISICVALNK